MVTPRRRTVARSRRDPGLPATYEARVDILAGRGREPVHDHYFSDTLCGLIEVLADQGITPAQTRLTGLFRGRRADVDVALCSDAEGRWLARPELCRVLEQHYEHTGDECTRGHVEKGTCAFADRERDGRGPVW